MIKLNSPSTHLEIGLHWWIAYGFQKQHNKVEPKCFAIDTVIRIYRLLAIGFRFYFTKLNSNINILGSLFSIFDFFIYFKSETNIYFDLPKSGIRNNF